jgi:type I restriction enzyme R subunit
MTHQITESTVEAANLSWFAALGYSILYGPHIAPGEPASERASFGDVLLLDRLRSALARINPTIPFDALDQAVRKLTHPDAPSLVENNHRFHSILRDGLDVEYARPDGSIAGDQVWLIDFANPFNNDWVAVNQFTVIEQDNRRPDVVVFVNGLPLAVIELKDPTDPNATIRHAFHQFQTYKTRIPSLFTTNELLVISDGIQARVGTLTSDWERFMPWRTIDGTDLAPKGSLELHTLTHGIFEQSRFLDLIRNFIVFEQDGPTLSKKLAGYHQFHAVNKALATTLKAVSATGDRRAGVIWHTQGSGKSLTMAFYAGKIIAHPAMHNPTLVLLTDRNDLDDQLFGTFSRCSSLLRQSPVQANDRPHLRQLLRVAAGGVIFTTIQKFMPEERGSDHPLLTGRRNIIVIADEAHRSQYDFIKGYARHLRDALPNAAFIGFTGTPIEAADKSTPAVFGDYIDIYDIRRAVEDGATVPIYYEGRLAKLQLREEERPHIDPDFEEVTEGEEIERKEKLKSKWARLEAMVGTDKRIALVAEDIVSHFDQRAETLKGKAMIVTMSRRIAVDLYNAIVALRPEWHSDDDKQGKIKVVMTGSASDPLPFQPHLHNKAAREAIANRFKKPADPMQLVIVRDMWLTGFDCPSLHTMYMDKPMRGHTLMQAIARVNRVFGDKPGGLIVDYLGLAYFLKQALADYTRTDRAETAIPQEEAVALLLEKYEIIQAMFHGFDYTRAYKGTPEQRLTVLPEAMDHIAAQPDGKSRFLKAVTELSKTFTLSVPNEEALAIRDDVAFFQAVRAAFIKYTITEGTDPEDLDSAIRQLVSKAVASDRIIDIFSEAGLSQPDIALLSDEFLHEVRYLPQRNLALELLQKLLADEIKLRSRKNVVEARSFAEMLDRSIRAYQNRTIEAAAVIADLIELAKEMRAARSRGEQLGLTDDELAFYDALETNDSAVQVLGDDTLRTIAHELVDTVRRNVTIDWTERETARANLRRLVKRILRKYGYPPDKQEQATITVLEQAAALGAEWAA